MSTWKHAENMFSTEITATIPDKALQHINSFKNRYLGNILRKTYASFPDIRSFIDQELILAIEDRKNDKIEALIDASNIPLTPYHAKLSDFDPSCLNTRDQVLFQQLTSLKFLYSDSPNLTLFGPQSFGCEKIAIGFADAICRALLRTYYIRYDHLLSTLILHRTNAKKNKEYESLASAECLIIEDCAGFSIHDRDLLPRYTHFSGRDLILISSQFTLQKQNIAQKFRHVLQSLPHAVHTKNGMTFLTAISLRHPV